MSEQTGPYVVYHINAYLGVEDPLDPQQRQHKHQKLFVLPPYQLFGYILPGNLSGFLIDVWLQTDKCGPRFFELVDQDIP